MVLINSMGSYMDAPSPILLKYATLGVKASPRGRMGVQAKDLAALHRPYRFIYRMSSSKKKHDPVADDELKHEEHQKDITPQRLMRRKGFKRVAPEALLVHHVEDSAHLSDVVEVIRADDPAFAVSALPGTMQAPAPYVYIVEQPAPKSLRFRYECEGRSAGSIPGVNSVQENKTFPTIKVCGYKGCMVIVVSCVTKDEPYKPHPHNLVGRDCQMGVCTVKVQTDGDADSCQVQFRNLGIQCVKRRDIAEALRVRQELRVNPFKTGYGHKSQPQSIDLNAVRLCFQVFLTDDAYKVQRALQPVVSDVVYDKKAMSDLLIVRSSHCSGPVRGGTTVILLCEKVTREDTEIWFFQEENGRTIWNERVPPEFVHKQLAVVFKTPAYWQQHVGKHVKVQFQLHRISDSAKSNAYEFEYIPEGQDIQFITLNKKRKMPTYNLEEYDERALAEMAIKAEPRERTPPHPMSNPSYVQEQWQVEAAAAAAAAASTSHASWYQQGPADRYRHQNVQNVQGMQMQHMQVGGGPALGQMSPLGHVSQATSPHLAPPLQCASPLTHCTSPMTHCASPMTHCASPMTHCVSPISQCVSPAHGAVSPIMMHNQMNMNMQAMPGLQQGMVHMQNTLDPVMGEIQQPTYTQMDSVVHSTPSLSALLMGPGDEEVPFTSGDLSNLSSMLNERNDLSDSLNRLSTKDLLH